MSFHEDLSCCFLFAVFVFIDDGGDVVLRQSLKKSGCPCPCYQVKDALELEILLPLSSEC